MKGVRTSVLFIMVGILTIFLIVLFIYIVSEKIFKYAP